MTGRAIPKLRGVDGSRATVLPPKSVVVRGLVGDTVALGTASARALLSDLYDPTVRGGAAATDVLTEPDAYYWSKWYGPDSIETGADKGLLANAASLVPDPANWVTTRRFTNSNVAEDVCLPLTDHTGLHATSGHASPADGESLGSAWVLNRWLRQLSPGYVETGGSTVPTVYVPWNTGEAPVGTNQAKPALRLFDPDTAGSAYEIYTERNLKACVNYLLGLDDVEHVFVESIIFIAGQEDGNDATDAGALGQNLRERVRDFRRDLSGEIPFVLYRPTPTGDTSLGSEAASITSWEDEFATAPVTLEDERLLASFTIAGIECQEAVDGSYFPGRTPTTMGMVEMARRWAVAIGDLGARGACLVEHETALS